MSAFIETDIDVRDTDSAIALSRSDQIVEMRQAWEAMTHAARLRWWWAASDAEQEALIASYERERAS